MKNKLLVFACAMALVGLSFTSCKEKTDFDAIVDQISEKTLKGYFSGAEMFGDEMKVRIVQFNFKDDGVVERTVMAEGNCVYEAPQKTVYASWALGDFYDGNAGRYIELYPAEGQPLRLRFFNGGLAEDGQPFAVDKNDKVADLASTDTTVLGHKWYGNDTVYYKIDTVVDVVKYDTVWTKKPRRDPETGEIVKDSTGHTIYDRVVKSITERIVPTKMKWPIAPKTIDIRRIEFYRDPVTLENTGKWYMMQKAFDINEKRELTPTLDTTATFDFHWAYIVYTSTAYFVVKAVPDDGKDVQFFEINYDFRLPSVTVEKQLLKIEK